MAKLDGVNVVDMQNGEITKIAHYGVEYTKVDGEAQAGDIVRVVGRSWGKIEEGAFYRSKGTRDGSGGKRFTDIEFQTSANGYVDDFVVYRKLTQPPKVSDERVSTPFAEMITSKVSAVEKRVAALEDAEGDGDTTELADGTRVNVLRDGQFRNIRKGSSGRIAKTRTTYSDDDPYNVRVTSGINIDYFRPQDLEAHTVATPPPPKPTVGDIVVITGNTNGSRNKVGDIGKVVEHQYNDEYSVTVDVPQRPKTGVRLNFTLTNEMRHATDAEKAEYEKAVKQADRRAAKDAVFTKAGRKPNEYRKGDIVRISEVMTLMGDLKVGDITEIIEDSTSDGLTGIEIVCFAEDRADIAKGGR